MIRDFGAWVQSYLPQIWGQLPPFTPKATLPSLSCRIVDALISGEHGGISFQLDISSENMELRSQNLAIYRALSQKIARAADLNKKEAGLRSLWLAYPFLLAPDLSEPEDASIVLAPIILWPIDIHVSLSCQGQITLSRDPKVSPYFNKALQSWVRNNLRVELRECEFEESTSAAFGRGQLEIAITKSVSGIPRLEMRPLTESIESLPTKAAAKEVSRPTVVNGAVLGIFVSENQALIDNLEGLRTVADVTGPLECLLSGKSKDPTPVVVPPESDRYLVASSDPFQEMATWDARNSPGAVVHGPPGTGKSQTIVNIIADALAHKQRVLVVCQKRAAIDVVYRRLRPAGISSLCTVVHDSEGDRSRVILSIKEQVLSVGQQLGFLDGSRRLSLSAQIERSESELDSYYKALQLSRPEIGLSYRSLVSRIGALAIENACVHPNREIGKLLTSHSDLSLKRLLANLGPVSSLYKVANPKANPWRYRASDFFLTANVVEQIEAAVSSAAR